MATYRHRQQKPLHGIRYGFRHFADHFISGTGHPHAGRSHKVRRPGTLIRRLVGAALVVVILVLVLLALSATLSVVRAKDSLQSARALIAQSLADKQAFLSTSGRAHLDDTIMAVFDDAAAAADDLHGSLGLKVLGHLPYLSSQRNGLLALADDTGTTAGTFGTLLHQADDLIDQSNGTTVSLSALHAFQHSVLQAQGVISRLNRPVGHLFGPLGRARRSFDHEISTISADLTRGNEGLTYLQPFLGSTGPRTYLIAGENNAEMREQGDVLSLALMTTQNGSFSVDTLGSVDSYQPVGNVDVPIPGADNLIFAGYNLTGIWQSVNATPDFPFSAQVMQAMYAQSSQTEVNGVIALDVPTLVSLLELSGPVQVPGVPGQITADNVAEVLLHQQYLQYPVLSVQGERHDNISAVAKAVVDRMKSEHIDLAALASAVATDMAGRHLIVWDEVPSYESTIRKLGGSGEIDTVAPDRTFHVALETSTATKLDYYMTTAIHSHVEVAPDGKAYVTTDVTVKNNTPAGLGPTFQTGPDDINSFIPGQYVGRVIVWSPRGSATPDSLPESGLELNQIEVSVLPQQSKTVSFATVIPHAVSNGTLELRFVPQPTLYPDALTITVSAPGRHVMGNSSVSTLLAETTTFAWRLSQ